MASRTDKPLFAARGLAGHVLTEKDAPVLQKLLERCHDYFEIVEGRRPKANAALRELRNVPPAVPLKHLIPIGLYAANGALGGIILALRHYPRENQWYLSLQLQELKWRGRGVGLGADRGGGGASALGGAGQPAGVAVLGAGGVCVAALLSAAGFWAQAACFD